MASHGGVVSLTNPGFELVTWEQGIGPYTTGPLQPQVTEEQFMVSKWNKHVEGSWRMFFD